MKPTLFLIPSALSEGDLNQVLPVYHNEVINSLDHFIVEDERTGRRFLKRAGYLKPIDATRFFVLNEHTGERNFSSLLEPMKAGISMGLLSDAGCPGVADPGAQVVRIAHQRNYKVEPLVGPSSILLALMASGLNGQGFTFHGYLPKEKGERKRKIQELDKTAQRTGFTQLFIETPYRNEQMVHDILESAGGETLLCIACDLTSSSEFIVTKKN